MLSFKLQQQFYAQEASLVRFDHNHELLWVSDDIGCIKSYHQGSIYTSTAVSHHQVIDMYAERDLIFGIGHSTLKAINARGVPKLFLHSFDALNCLAKSNHYLHLGGNKLTDVDVATSKIVKERDYPTSRLYAQHNKLYTSDTTNMYILDYKSNDCLAVTDSNGIITNIEAFGDYILTTGSTLSNGAYRPDAFAKLYDSRMLQLINIIPFSFGAAHLRPHQRVPSAFYIGSYDGQLMIYDVINQLTSFCEPLGHYTRDFSISKSGDCLAAVDDIGQVSIYETFEGAYINKNSLDIERPTVVEFPRTMTFGDSFSIPPKPSRHTLSNDMSMFTNIKRIPPPIDPSVLAMATFKNNIGHVPNKLKIKRNLYQTSKATVEDPVFKSQKHKKSPVKQPQVAGIPEMYLKKEIKYSKYGIEDFNFKLFNTTKYAGLENHITNCYLNALLALFYAIPDLNNFCIHHISINCELASCFVCELGFLFKCLCSAQGANCQATNFLMAFTNNSTSTLLQLNQPMFVNETIQKANRFILDQMYLESSKTEQQLFAEAFGFKFKVCKKCLKCNQETQQQQVQFVLELSNKYSTFNENLTSSLNLNDQIKATCKKCLKQTPHGIQKTLVQMPNVVLLNVNASKPFDLIHQISVKDISYDLKGVVSEINNNLVAQILYNEWILFNDFLVEETTPNDVTKAVDYKNPCILLYRKSSYIELPSSVLDTKAMIDFLKQSSSSVSPILSPSNVPVVALQSYENIGPGFMVALDAEFVSLQEELVEFKSDGSKTVKRPTRLHLARVSVLRGEGFHEGKPFIDDYIVPKEEIHDYLTKFSGIQKDDLDPKKSRKRLLHLKTVYKKIRMLIDLGCIFIGHGLKNDLRIISNCD